MVHRFARPVVDMGVVVLLANTAFAYRIWWKGFKAFEDGEGKRYMLDKSSINRNIKYHKMYCIPDQLFPALGALWMIPQNGQICLGKSYPEYPNWIQLQNGRWIVSSVVGMTIARELGPDEFPNVPCATYYV